MICGTARVVCLLGETGSGKSTQVPQMILQQAPGRGELVLRWHDFLTIMRQGTRIDCMDSMTQKFADSKHRDHCARRLVRKFETDVCHTS